MYITTGAVSPDKRRVYIDKRTTMTFKCLKMSTQSHLIWGPPLPFLHSPQEKYVHQKRNRSYMACWNILNQLWVNFVSRNSCYSFRENTQWFTKPGIENHWVGSICSLPHTGPIDGGPKEPIKAKESFSAEEATGLLATSLTQSRRKKRRACLPTYQKKGKD